MGKIVAFLYMASCEYFRNYNHLIKLYINKHRAPAPGGGSVQGGIDFSQGTRRPDGKLCVIKESQVDTVVKDPILECTHKNVEKCHYTYVTQFKPAQEEVIVKKSINIMIL